MSQTPPFFSVVVPTFARGDQLSQCLRSLANLDYPKDRFEVVVVDDGGEMPESAISAFRDQLCISLCKQAHSGPARARNMGAMQAKGEFLAFTDDDCAPATDWLQRLAANLESPQCIIGGRTINSLTKNAYSTASQLLIRYLYEYYNRDPNRARFFTSNNMAVAREYFFRVGGFDATFLYSAAEDREFCDRWQYSGYWMRYVPQAVVYHAHPLTFRSFWRQHWNYGRGAWCFHRARARRDQKRIQLEPSMFYINLLLYSFRELPGRRAYWLAALLGISQVANAAGFVWQAATR